MSVKCVRVKSVRAELANTFAQTLKPKKKQQANDCLFKNCAHIIKGELSLLRRQTVDLDKTTNVRVKKCSGNGTSHTVHNFTGEGCIFMADGFFFFICSHNFTLFPQIAL